MATLWATVRTGPFLQHAAPSPARAAPQVALSGASGGTCSFAHQAVEAPPSAATRQLADPAGLAGDLVDLLHGVTSLMSPIGQRLVPGPEEAQLPQDGSCVLSRLGGRGTSCRLDPNATVRPPVRTRVNPIAYSGFHRVKSILTKGLKVRIPVEIPRVWVPSPDSTLMRGAVNDFVACGVLRPSRKPINCYRLFPVPKSASIARLVYDLSQMTPFMPSRPCNLPTVQRAACAAGNGYRYAIKIDLRDGFYHLPLAESTQPNFGVLFRGETFVFTRLPMGLSIAPSEMQEFACCTVKIVQAKFPGVIGLSYIDDLLFMSRDPVHLEGIPLFLDQIGLQINYSKSVLQPTSYVLYLGLNIDLEHGRVSVSESALPDIRQALTVCSTQIPLISRQRMAGYINFVRPCLKLPLEVVKAVLDGDSAACMTVLPYITSDVCLSAVDIVAVSSVHRESVYTDATPVQIGIVDGDEELSIALPCQLDIYIAEYLAALVAVLTRDMKNRTLYTDNVGVLYNLDKGRCPRAWLPVLLGIFRSRTFSVAFVPSEFNLADRASRL